MIHTFIAHRIVATVAMPIVAAGGWAGYNAYQNPNQYQQNQYPQYQSTNGQLSSYAVDAPSQLSIGQSGTWTVRVVGNTYNGGQLHYSVQWGDENMGGTTYAANSYYSAQTVNSSGSFTHVYNVAGTFRPIFTVTDDYGHATQASASTLVTGNGAYGNGGNGGTTGYCPQGYYFQNGYCYANNSNGGYNGTTGNNSAYCNSNAGWYDRNCGHTNGGNTGGYTGGYTSGTGNYPSGCTTFYDRDCYVNNQYVGPSFGGSGTTYNGPGDTCYYLNGQWQGNCSNTSGTNGSYNSGYNRGYNGGNYNSGYNSSPNGQNTLGGPNGVDYSCYYDRACLAQSQGRGF